VCIFHKGKNVLQAYLGLLFLKQQAKAFRNFEAHYFKNISSKVMRAA